jgi:DegT/DnrJ/EryC1/StrS aminotransferase family
MHDEPTHHADVVDGDLLGDIAAAAAWWAGQRTWRVSSSHTGGGVIAALEDIVASSVSPRAYALALPSATVALATALEIVGVAAGSALGVPALDWSASAGVLSTRGICAVPLPVRPDSGLLDAERLAEDPSLTRGLAAVIAVHLHGLTCDVPALRRACPGLPIVEDAAQAWGARYRDGEPVGSAADACAFSFGAAKSPSAGELGCLVTRTPRLHQAGIALTQHPTRQLLAGITSPRYDRPMARVAPAAALIGTYVISRHAVQAPGLRQAGAILATALRETGLLVISDTALHAPGVVAVRAVREEVLAGLRGSRPGVAIASVDSADLSIHPEAKDDQSLRDLVAAVTVVTVAGHGRQHGLRSAGSGVGAYSEATLIRETSSEFKCLPRT